MAKTYSFGAGGTASSGTNSGPYSVFTQVYSVVGEPTLRNNAFALKTVTINGSASGFASRYYDINTGRVGFNVNANATLNFTRYIGNGGSVIRSPQSFTWTNGGLQGNITYVTAPTQPGSLTASASGTTISISVGAPTDDGGSSVSGYEIEISSDGGSSYYGTQSSSGSSFQYTGLSVGTYRIRARVKNQDNFWSIYRVSDSVTISVTPPGNVSGLFASSLSQTTITISWNSTSGATSYTVYLNGSAIDTTGNTFYTFGSLTQNTTYTLGVRANNDGGSSPSITSISATTLPIEYTYTISYSSNGGSGSMSPTTRTSTNTAESLTVASNGFTRTGYTFVSWNTNSSGTGTSYQPQSTLTLTSSNPSITLFAQWQLLAPGFTDQSITGTVPINININTLADNRVIATNADQYSLISASGTFPTWLSINNSGFLSGSTNVPGTYTFAVRATNSTSGQSVDSNTLTIAVIYPGKRATSSSTVSNMGSARRWNGSSWVNLTVMKRWNGSAWVDISN